MGIYFSNQNLIKASKKYKADSNIKLKLKEVKIIFPKKNKLPPHYKQCARIADMIERGPVGEGRKKTTWQVKNIKLF